MEISKSTPYVRYRENISSTLHKGTIHIESEYLDRERKTTIESIEGQTWQNMVNGENKEEDILPRLGLKIEGNEDIFDTVEQHMSIDTIIGDVEPVANEDGTYTYEISTIEGSYAKTLDGENNFSLTSDGLVGDMYIKYNAQGEEVNGSIVMDNGQSSYTIENSNNGEINNVTLKGQTLVNLVNNVTSGEVGRYNGSQCRINVVRDLQDETLTIIFNVTSLEIPDGADGVMRIGGGWSGLIRHNPTLGVNKILYNFTQSTNNWLGVFSNLEAYDLGQRITISDVMILEGDYTNVDIPYFEGMQSVENPTVITSNSPVQFGKGGRL